MSVAPSGCPVQGVHHIALQVEDVQRTAEFYQQLLGVGERVRHHHPDGSLRSIWLDLEARPNAAFLAIEDRPDEATHFGLKPSMIALRVTPTDRVTLVARARALGVPLVKESRWTSYFRDPEGNVIGVSHYPEEQPDA